jgi:hypothetical protein
MHIQQIKWDQIQSRNPKKCLACVPYKLKREDNSPQKVYHVERTLFAVFVYMVFFNAR